MGKLSKNVNLSLDSLIKRIDKNENRYTTVFAYTIDTVIFENKKLKQTGCAPNFQGDFITLCNCKHKMRARNENKEFWENNWIAGICSKQGKTNALFYLMKISSALKSHYHMWNYLSSYTRKAKSTHRNIFGDIYEPKKVLNKDERHLKKFYKSNCSNHKHNHLDNVEYDIEQKFWGNYPYLRYPYLLVGDPVNSFLWEVPKIYSDYRRTTNFREKDFSFPEFIRQLSEE